MAAFSLGTRVEIEHENNGSIFSKLRGTIIFQNGRTYLVKCDGYHYPKPVNESNLSLLKSQPATLNQ